MCSPNLGPGPTPATILWFGDSIVRGAEPLAQGPRRALWDYHVSIGYKMQLIGTQLASSGGLTQTYHDGHAGRDLQWLRDNVIAVSYGAGNAIESADLICVHGGTNNMGFGVHVYDPVLTPQLYYDTLEDLHLALPMARICPATVGPFDRATLSAEDDNAIDFRSKLLNDVLPDFETAYPGVLIHGWDARMCLNGGVWSAGNFVDATHPNATGYAAMNQDSADGLIQALQAAGVHS